MQHDSPTPPADAALADAVQWARTEAKYWREHLKPDRADRFTCLADAAEAALTRPSAPPSEGAALAQEYRDLAEEIGKHCQPAGSVVTAAPADVARELAEALDEAVTLIRRHVPVSVLGYNADGDLVESCLTRSWPVLAEHLHYMDAALEKARAAGLLEEGA